MNLKIMDLDPVRRNAVLNAALKEFAFKGYDNASTNVIAKEADISKALMFHYVNNKQDLFLFVYDYFSALLDKKYFSLMDFSNNDIFDRLQQSYLLQIELLKQYPWIFDFNKLSIETGSDLINKKLTEQADRKQGLCQDQLFDAVDESKFRKGLDAEKCCQLILWANIGFTEQLVNDIRNAGTIIPDYDSFIKRVNNFLDELRKVFYT